MICEFCGYEFSDDLGRYGCPNCEGDGLMDKNSEANNLLARMRAAVESEKIVKVEVRNVFGNDLIYPANYEAERFAAIAGKKTLGRCDLLNIRALGFTVEEVSIKKLVEA